MTNYVDLVQRCLANDAAAKEILFLGIAPKVRWACERYLSEDQDVEDATQETLLRVFLKLDQFDAELGEFLGWVYRISKNEALRILNKQARTEHAQLGDNENLPGEKDVIGEISHRELMNLVETLSGNMKEVFVQHMINGYTYEEIDQQMNLRTGASRLIYFRARRELRRKFAALRFSKD